MYIMSYTSNTYNSRRNSQRIERRKSQRNNASMYMLFHFIAFVYAIFLSFKCNHGFSLGSFLVAFFCPYIYIIYIFATKGYKMCIN